MFGRPDRRPPVVLIALALLAASLVLVLRSSRDDYARLLEEARRHADRAERTQAVGAYRDIARLYPADPLPFLELAQVYLSWGRYDEALDAISEGERRGAGDAQLEWMRVRIYARRAEAGTDHPLSDWRAVTRHAKRLLALEPDQRAAHAALARAYLHLREWKAARSIYEALLLLDPSDGIAREAVGVLLLGDDPAALDHLEACGTGLTSRLLDVVKAHMANESTVYLHTLVGRTLVEQRAWTLGARHLERAVEHRSDYADAHAYLGHALDQMGYWDEARSHLIRATELAPASAVAHTFLGLHFDRRGDVQAAREAYETAYDLVPDASAICVEIGQTWAAEGRYVAAEVWLREAVALRPLDPALWEILARFYLDHHITSSNRAVDAAQRLLELAPDSARAYDLRGWAALQVGQYQSAERYLERAIELDNELASAYYHLGLVWNAEGRPARADEAFDRAIDLDTTGRFVPLVERVR